MIPALLLSLRLVILLPVVYPSALGGGFLHSVGAEFLRFGDGSGCDNQAKHQNNKFLHGSVKFKA